MSTPSLPINTRGAVSCLHFTTDMMKASITATLTVWQPLCLCTEEQIVVLHSIWFVLTHHSGHFLFTAANLNLCNRGKKTLVVHNALQLLGILRLCLNSNMFFSEKSGIDAIRLLDCNYSSGLLSWEWTEFEMVTMSLNQISGTVGTEAWGRISSGVSD